MKENFVRYTCTHCHKVEDHNTDSYAGNILRKVWPTIFDGKETLHFCSLLCLHGHAAKNYNKPKAYMNSTKDRLYRIIADNLGLSRSEIKYESTFTDLGADSLDLVEITMAVEEEFDIELADEDVEKVRTVKECLDLIGREKMSRPWSSS